MIARGAWSVVASCVTAHSACITLLAWVGNDLIKAVSFFLALVFQFSGLDGNGACTTQVRQDWATTAEDLEYA